jgi:hypothetical protein
MMTQAHQKVSTLTNGTEELRGRSFRRCRRQTEHTCPGHVRQRRGV